MGTVVWYQAEPSAKLRNRQIIVSEHTRILGESVTCVVPNKKSYHQRHFMKSLIYNAALVKTFSRMGSLQLSFNIPIIVHGSQ